jgi:hypothetical protein
MTPARTPSPAPTSALAVVVHAPGGVSMALPPVIADAGEAAARFTLEFFASRIPNANTRKAYGRAVFRFCAWCHAQGVGLRALAPPTLSAYLEGLDVSPASVKLTASALRRWLDYLTERGVLTHNPALSVRTARLVVTEGKTPVLERAQARKLVASLDAAATNERRQLTPPNRRRTISRRGRGRLYFAILTTIASSRRGPPTSVQ